jgi:arylsulfatase A-like enzyme
LRLPNSLCGKELAIFSKSLFHRTGGSHQPGFETGSDRRIFENVHGRTLKDKQSMSDIYLSKDVPGVMKRPNVIWFLTDQFRAQAQGFMGDKNVRTPNIDNLAREGMVFSSAIAGAPWCCPFRGAMITGLYPHQNGVIKTPSALAPDIPTITAPFKEAGYHTAWIGKWHLDGSNSPTHLIPPERRGGFDYFMGYENNNNQNEVYVHGSDSEEPLRIKKYETDGLTDIFIEHLQEHISEKNVNGDYQPFFAVLSVQPPHDPHVPPTDVNGQRLYYHAPEEIDLRQNVPLGSHWERKARIDLAGYYGQIENIDTNLGRLRMVLKGLDIDKETYIIFFSDHGECVGSHGQWGKSTPWEEAIRIPFIIGCTGGLDNMCVGNLDYPLNHVDIAPTTLGLCNINTPPAMKGFDFSPFCITKSRAEYHELSGMPPQSAYLQQIPRKYHTHSVNKAWRAVVTKDGWKYVCFPGDDWLLFDLKDDPYEIANLCHDTMYQDKKQELQELLQSWIHQTGDSFELPDITLYNAIKR